MKYGSVCSGIEAATVAWDPLGWQPAFFSEIEKFPRAVLKHHYPDVPLYGDFTQLTEAQYAGIDLLVGGTPCQSFSIAGKRGGLADPRGRLSIEYIKLAYRSRAQWVVWENVRDALNADKGEAFRCFLSGLVGWHVDLPGGGWKNAGIVPGLPGKFGVAWRVLDAQYFGVPQRRRRVFVVGYLGDWRPAAAVLFERESLQGHPAPRRKTRQGTANSITASAGSRSASGLDQTHLVAGPLPAREAGGGTLGTDFECAVGMVFDSHESATHSFIPERQRHTAASCHP